MRTLIKNGKILLWEGKSFKVADGDIAIKDNIIDEIRLTGKKKFDEKLFDKVIDASDSLVMPGLINAHTHAYMSIFRNYADDLEFFDWLNRVQTVEDRMTGEDCYWTTLLSVIEMYKTGTTCFVDMNIKSSIDGAKKGTLTIRSAGSGIGKTRNAVADACYLAYPFR